MERVWISGGEWSRHPVLRAEGFADRFRGLKGLDPGTSLLLATSSVHSVGLGRPFTAVGLTDGFVVAGSRVVKPNRIARFPGCSYVLELPIDVPPPSVGSTLEVTGD